MQRVTKSRAPEHDLTFRIARSLSTDASNPYGRRRPGHASTGSPAFSRCGRLGLGVCCESTRSGLAPLQPAWRHEGAKSWGHVAGANPGTSVPSPGGHGAGATARHDKKGTTRQGKERPSAGRNATGKALTGNHRKNNNRKGRKGTEMHIT